MPQRGADVRCASDKSNGQAKIWAKFWHRRWTDGEVSPHRHPCLRGE